MNEKLQRLAKRMVDLFPDKEFSTPQECFTLFKEIYKKQVDYFRNFEPQNTIKLIFYIYSLKNTGDFKLAEKLLNNLGFASLFITQGNSYMVSCEYCGGDGTTNCDVCDATGEVDCDECSSNGETVCQDCDGTGNVEVNGENEQCEYCDGDGEVDCPECNGNGKVTCQECYGNGTEECQECDGTGEVESGEVEYEYYVIVTWDQGIKDRCELTAGTLEPALSEYDFDLLRDEYLVVGYQDDHAEFRSRVMTNEIYCTNYEDEPELHKSYSETFWVWMDNDNLSSYTL
jgi:hypothetical protein